MPPSHQLSFPPRNGTFEWPLFTGPPLSPINMVTEFSHSPACWKAAVRFLTESSSAAIIATVSSRLHAQLSPAPLANLPKRGMAVHPNALWPPFVADQGHCVASADAWAGPPSDAALAAACNAPR